MNRISNRFNSTAVHLELYETCVLVGFCKSNELLTEVIYFVKDLDLWQDSKDATGIHFKKFPIQFTLHQGQKPCWIQLLSMQSSESFKILTEKS